MPSTTSMLATCDAMSASLHLARTVCRRAERSTVTLALLETRPERCVIYLNRLSDALFVTARWVVHRAGSEEHLWRP